MKKINSLSIEEIKHLAKLSNLNLSEEELKIYQKQLEETVEYVNNLSKLKTNNIKPTSHTTNLINVFFEDGLKNKREINKEQVLSNTKNKNQDFFVVRRIL